MCNGGSLPPIPAPAHQALELAGGPHRLPWTLPGPWLLAEEAGAWQGAASRGAAEEAEPLLGLGNTEPGERARARQDMKGRALLGEEHLSFGQKDERKGQEKRQEVGAGKGHSEEGSPQSKPDLLCAGHSGGLGAPPLDPLPP